MKNQVEALRGYGVKVHILSSETTFPERQEVGFGGFWICDLIVSPAFSRQRLLISLLHSCSLLSAHWNQIEKDLASGHPYARLLYITPESLFSPKFLKSIKIVVGQKELRRLVVDEAHCISVSRSSKSNAYIIRQGEGSAMLITITFGCGAVVRNGVARSGLNIGSWAFSGRSFRISRSWWE
jgi:hypothetical protein